MKCELCKDAEAFEVTSTCIECKWAVQYLTVNYSGAVATDALTKELFSLIRELRQRIFDGCQEMPSMRMSAVMFAEHMDLLSAARVGAGK